MSRFTAALMAVFFACCLAAGCSEKKKAHSRVTSPKQVASGSRTEEATPEPRESGGDPYTYSPPVTGKLGEEQEAAAERTRPEGLPAGHPLLKKWPRPIESALISPGRKTIALYDGKGVFLTDPQGGTIRRLRITLKENLANEYLTVAFAFRRDGRRVAILTTLVYGEPTGAFIERLWTADTWTGKVRRLREWMDRVQGRGPITAERELEGWTKDGRSVVVSGTIYDGIDMPSEARNVGTERVNVRDKPL